MTEKLEKLAGKELLDEVKRLKSQKTTPSAMAAKCGYIDKNARPLMKSFYAAITTAATGVKVGGDRPLSYKTSITKKENLFVSSGYIREMGWEVGDELSIILEKDSILIKKDDSTKS